MDDCVDRSIEYAAGGARYNWSVINVVGLANVIDSLAAVREVVFEKQECSAEELLAALDASFEGHEALRQRLERCPRFGNGDGRADDLAQRVSAHVFARLLERTPWRGGRFLGSCLMFVTYADFGKPVKATPDGRRAGEPVADSAGAYQGRDVSGPTALLRSAAMLDQIHAPGTLIVNIRVAKEHFATPHARENLKALIRGYFDLGGMQLQIAVLDQATLRDALDHPERHGDLIIRVGGYSEYWKNLTPEIRRTVLQRTEH
jgi:formate C-acetyltransferase